MEKPYRAVAYYRVSAPKQSKDRANAYVKLAAQKRQIETYARSTGTIIAKYFTDTDDSQSGLQAAYKFSKSKQISYLLVINADRFARNATFLSEWELKFKQIGIEVIVICSSPTESFLDNLQKVMAQLDEEIRSKLVVEKMTLRLLDGYSVSRPHIGYRVTKQKGLHAPTSYGKAIGSLLAGVADDNYDLMTAAGLIRLGMERRRGGTVRNQEVFRLMANPYYAGYNSFQGKLYLGKHKALITMQQHAKVHKMIVAHIKPRAAKKVAQA